MSEKESTDFVVKLDNISKAIGKSSSGIKDISFEIKRGEIVALVGESGSGKEIISNILSGYLKPDSGKIIFDDDEYDELFPNQALNKGVVTASSEYSLCINMNILENLFLIGYKERANKFGMINYGSLKDEAINILYQLGSKYNLNVPLRELEQHDIPVVEVAKALLSRAKLYVFDEVSKMMKESNFIKFANKLKQLKEKGKSALFIPSKLAEVFEVADRIIIIRNGRIATILDVDETNLEELPEFTISSEKALLSVIQNKLTHLENSAEKLKEFVKASIDILTKSMAVKDVAFIVFYDNEPHCIYSNKIKNELLIEAINNLSKSMMSIMMNNGSFEDIQDVLSKNLDTKNYHDEFIPLESGGETLGVALIFQKSLDKYHQYKDITNKFINIFSKSLKNFMDKEHMKKEERELETAGQIQKSMSSPDFNSFKYLDVFGYSLPAKTVGGDYYDMFKINDKKYVGIIADVSGKGIPAALIMVMIRSILKNSINMDVNSNKLMEILNDTLHGEIPKDRYATVFLFILDIEKMTIDYCNGGHHAMMLYRKNNKNNQFFNLDTEGVPVGVIPEFEYQNKRATIKDDDLFIIYTDGITEAMSKDREEFGKKRLMKIIMKYNDYKSNELSEIIKQAIKTFSEGKQHDDETLLIFKLKSEKPVHI